MQLAINMHMQVLTYLVGKLQKTRDIYIEKGALIHYILLTWIYISNLILWKGYFVPH